MSDSRIDGSLYPDREPPVSLSGMDESMDYIQRLCSAWDFGILPDAETETWVRGGEWREAVDACRLLTSPAYHLLREWHGLPRLPYLGCHLAYIQDDPNLNYV